MDKEKVQEIFSNLEQSKQPICSIWMASWLSLFLILYLQESVFF